MNVLVKIRTEHIDGWKTRMEVGTLTNTGYSCLVVLTELCTS